MDPAGAEPTPRRRPWSRPWVRRLTYVLASGAAIATLAAWVARRDFVRDWALVELDRLSREETGLPLKVEDLELRLMAGHVVLHRVSWGTDLVQAERVDLIVEPYSLLGNRPRIRSVRIQGFRSVLDAPRLAAMRFRSRPPVKDPVKVWLGELRLEDGRVDVREPAWGLPKAEFLFQVRAQGSGWNQGHAELLLDQAKVAAPAGTLAGKGHLEGDFSETSGTLRKADLALGASRLSASLRVDFPARSLDGKGKLHLDLQELTRVFPLPVLQGLADLSLQAKGPFAQPRWEAEVAAKELKQNE